RRHIDIFRWHVESSVEGRLGGVRRCVYPRLGFITLATIAFRSVALGAGHVKDDGCVAIFLGHGREGAEDEAIDVSDDGGATRGDAAFGEEIVEIAEGFIESFGGLKVLAFA